MSGRTMYHSKVLVPRNARVPSAVVVHLGKQNCLAHSDLVLVSLVDSYG